MLPLRAQHILLRAIVLCLLILPLSGGTGLSHACVQAARGRVPLVDPDPTRGHCSTEGLEGLAEGGCGQGGGPVAAMAP